MQQCIASQYRAIHNAIHNAQHFVKNARLLTGDTLYSSFCEFQPGQEPRNDGSCLWPRSTTCKERVIYCNFHARERPHQRILFLDFSNYGHIFFLSDSVGRKLCYSYVCYYINRVQSLWIPSEVSHGKKSRERVCYSCDCRKFKTACADGLVSRISRFTRRVDWDLH